MGIIASWKKYVLQFKFLAKTSRDELRTRDIWLIFLSDGDKVGIGECAMLAGLSIDDKSNFEELLSDVCSRPEHYLNSMDSLKNWPSVRFGLEMASRSLYSPNPFEIFPSDFTRGNYDIPMNGLVWMGSSEQMQKQLTEKLEAGFKCIKLKIGAINWEDELNILKHLRSLHNRKDLEIRVDANGAFTPGIVHQRLEELAKLDIHSIEQPVKAGQWDLMKELCASSPVPIAFDEELIPVINLSERRKLLEHTMPQYLVLKPTLLGGFESSNEWIELADDLGLSYWVTSALESNVGLNALAKWVATLKPGHKYQGLGTGQLYHNNFSSALELKNGALHYRTEFQWNIKEVINA